MCCQSRPVRSGAAYDGVYNIQRCQPGPNQDKAVRMFACCNLIENGFVYLPEKADGLTEYLNELTVFPNGKHDDQVDPTSQALLICSGIFSFQNFIGFNLHAPP